MFYIMVWGKDAEDWKKRQENLKEHLKGKGTI